MKHALGGLSLPALLGVVVDMTSLVRAGGGVAVIVAAASGTVLPLPLARSLRTSFAIASLSRVLASCFSSPTSVPRPNAMPLAALMGGRSQPH